MKYRAHDANDDYVFGAASHFLTDEPAAVAQAIETRLKLFVDEWFLDLREGLDRSQILGYGTAATRDGVIKQRILETPGVLLLVSYESRTDVRGFLVNVIVDTVYGRAILNKVL